MPFRVLITVYLSVTDKLYRYKFHRNFRYALRRKQNLYHIEFELQAKTYRILQRKIYRVTARSHIDMYNLKIVVISIYH